MLQPIPLWMRAAIDLVHQRLDVDRLQAVVRLSAYSYDELSGESGLA
jgi:hypothetical protein